MEIAGVFAVNKADQPGAERLEQQLRAMLSLLPAGRPRPRIVRTVATEDAGVADLVEALLRAPPRSRTRRKRTGVGGCSSASPRVCWTPSGGATLDRAAEDAAAGKLNPYEFVRQAVAQATGGGEK